MTVETSRETSTTRNIGSRRCDTSLITRFPSVRSHKCVKKHIHIFRQKFDTGDMESTTIFASPRTILTQANVAKTAALSSTPLLLSALTEGRFVPLALLTAFIGLALVSIRKSSAEHNRSTTENIVIASLLILATVVWGYFLAGSLFLVVPVVAVLATRGTARRPAASTAPDAERVLVRR